MNPPLRVLLVEDSELDAELLLKELQGAGLKVNFDRVETAAAMKARLEAGGYDLVLADYSLPQFSAPDALALLKEKGLDIPFIIVSGSIGEEIAVAMMKAGASDYIMKGRLARLAPAIERELRDARIREERRRVEAEVKKSREQLRALAAKLQAVREEEGTRIAREIHDEFGATLTSIKFDLAWMRSRLDGTNGDFVRAQMLEKIDAVRAVADGTVARVREFCTQLRPSVLDDLGLVAALHWQVKEFEGRTKIRCEAELPAEGISVPGDQATAIFRIFQELLTNVVRHAHASKVRVALHRNGAGLTLDVTDNGRGIRSEDLAGTKSLGVLGMRERAELLGGTFSIEGGVGKGTKVRVTMPVAAPAKVMAA